MGDLADAVAATDGPWALAAIAVIGLYVLLWKYTGQILQALKHNADKAEAAVRVADDVHKQVGEITTAISTNHGSNNIGAAIDRITEWLMLHREEARADSEALQALRMEFVHHLLAVEGDRTAITATMATIDDRLTSLESKQTG